MCVHVCVHVCVCVCVCVCPGAYPGFLSWVSNSYSSLLERGYLLTFLHGEHFTGSSFLSSDSVLRENCHNITIYYDSTLIKAQLDCVVTESDSEINSERLAYTKDSKRCYSRTYTL